MIGPAEFLAIPVGEHLPGLVLDALGAASEIDAPGRFGPYRVTREIGRGGMGMVYEARRADHRYDRRVAIKTVAFPAPGGLLARRFEEERRILAGLEHPSIARLYDAGTTPEGVPYLVMEYVEGRRIDRYCDEEGLSVEERLELLDRVCEAIEYAHGRLVVHRDLKPGNILVTDDGVPKLLDFGVARLLDPAPEGGVGTATATTIGARALTPEYASPEQLRGEPVTTSADVYALGVLSYVLLSGRHPYRFGSRSTFDVERTIRSQPLRPPSEVLEGEHATRRARLRGDPDNIVLTALRPEAERRYASVGHLRRDIRRHLDGFPIEARPATWRYRARKFVGRNRAGLAAAVLVLMSLGGGLAGVSWQARAAAAQAERAELTRDYLIGLFQTFDPDDSGIGAVTAEQLLDRGVERLEQDLAGQPVTRAELAGVLGRLYQRLGRYDKALPLLTSARAVLVEANGEEHPETVGLTARLASVLIDEGDYEEAEELARRVVEARRRALGELDTLVATALRSLASIRRQRGYFDEAAELHRQALEIDRVVGTPDKVATGLNNLGVTLGQLGDYEEAGRMHEEALALRREMYGSRHTLVATSLLNLSAIRRLAGDYDEAEALLTECIEIRRELLGDEHPHVAIGVGHLGATFLAMGRLDEAEAAHREALAIRRAAFGDTHPLIASDLNNLGVTAYRRGDYAGALEHFSEAVTMWREHVGDEHPEVLRGRMNLAAVRTELGEYEDAERALREVLSARRRVLPDDHPDIGQSLHSLADLLRRRGAMEEAERTYRDAITQWRRSLGDEHPTLATGLLGIGQLFVETGRSTECEAPLREGLTLREARSAPESPNVASARAWLGLCLVQLGDAEESVALLEAALPSLLERWGPEDDIVRRTRTALARVAGTSAAR
ncbi:MAG: tetratricopeptide repeat protein [Gemmatimonadota bacterium]